MKEYKVSPFGLESGQSGDAVIEAPQSPTGFWAAEWDPEHEGAVPLRDEHGDYIPYPPEPWEEIFSAPGHNDNQEVLLASGRKFMDAVGGLIPGRYGGDDYARALPTKRRILRLQYWGGRSSWKYRYFHQRDDTID